LEFRRRHNTYFATLNAYASHDPIGIVTSSEIDIRTWLGIADRDVIKRISERSTVLLDITARRRMILEPYVRLGPGIYMVGVVIESGVVGVMDKGRPMIRLVKNRRYRLDRSG